MKAPRVVAEIGCNHRGDLGIAKEMIGIAATFAKCDCVKFQKRHNRELPSPEECDAPHPVPANSCGDSYGAHRERLEFSLAQHRELTRKEADILPVEQAQRDKLKRLPGEQAP